MSKSLHHRESRLNSKNQKKRNRLRRRTLRIEQLEYRQPLAGDVVTGLSPFDLNGDGYTSPVDALMLANAISPQAESSSMGNAMPTRFDVDGNRAFDKLDFDAIVENVSRERGFVTILEGEGEEEMPGESPCGENAPSGWLQVTGSAYENEGSVMVKFHFEGTACAFSVDYYLASGTANGGAQPYGPDFSIGTPGSIAFPHSSPFLQSKVQDEYLGVLINNENLVELNEYFWVVITAVRDANGNAVNTVQFAPQSAVYIENDDLALIKPSDITITEGDAGTKVANLTVTLSNPVDTDVTVDWATEDWGASSAEGDYVSTSGTLLWMAGLTYTSFPSTIQVTVKGDTKVELSEAIGIILSNIQASNRNVTFEFTQLSDGSWYEDKVGTIVITDDDVGTVHFMSTLYQASEATGKITFTLRLDSDVDAPVRVTVGTFAGTAQADEGDYSPFIMDVTFDGNQGEEKTVEVSVNNENLVELTEDFVVQIGSVSASGRNVVAGSPSSSTGRILNDDSAVVNISDSSIWMEGDWNDETMTFDVTLTNPVDTAVSISYHTVAVSAMGNVDYGHITNGTLTIPAKSTSGTISITIFGDDLTEPAETFEVHLTSVTAGGRAVSLGDDKGIGTIPSSDP